PAAAHLGAARRAACADGDGRGSEPGDAGGDRARGPPFVRVGLAPARDGTGLEARARVVAARGDLDDLAVQAHDRDRPVTGLLGPVAELALLVVTPALDGSGAGEGARVVVAGRDLDDTAEAGDPRRPLGVPRRPITELA